MRIEHVALWTKDLEKLKDFYIRYFNASANEKYTNPVKKFQSYFLTFEGGARLEIMRRPDIEERDDSKTYFGYAHIAFAVGSKEKVLELTETLRNDGYVVHSEPRTTGDGYFESGVLDPEGNLVEITI